MLIKKIEKEMHNIFCTIHIVYASKNFSLTDCKVHAHDTYEYFGKKISHDY